MYKFRKKPVVIEAIQWNATDEVEQHLIQQGAKLDRPSCGNCSYIKIWNEPKKQWIRCPYGHFVIKGVEGEFYPCDPRIFNQTYTALHE